MKLYALRNKKSGKFYTIYISSNGDAEFCSAATVEFWESWGDDTPWVAGSKGQAEKAIWENSEWYNSGIEQPCHPDNWNSNDIEIVEFEIVVPDNEI